ncbi:haloacid dehalogenase type II [Halobacteriales archaeon QS_3_64_16]|nr:MAG: haloacid dehalogenase type II [Halobacteriales archaeon QS_3_64_16]
MPETTHAQTTTDGSLDSIELLAFDLYDTLLDRRSVLVPSIEATFERAGHDGDPEVFLRRYLAMHFRDSLVDSLLGGEHTSFEEITRRALAYRFVEADVEVGEEDVERIVEGWYRLDPYPEVNAALDRLGETYGLVGLSNGDPAMLETVRPAFDTDLDGTLSVAEAGAYKPHPAPYELLGERYGVDPGEVLFVSAHTFDLLGAKAVGMRGAYLNRHANPYGEWPQRPDLEVGSAPALAEALLDD